MFNFKDVIPKDLQSNLVYQYSCSSCNATYIGKTQRRFKVRACELLGITPLTGKKVKTPKSSAIIEHLIFTEYDASFNDFKILTKETNGFKLLIKESLLIARDNPSLNKNIYSTPLELFT